MVQRSGYGACATARIKNFHSRMEIIIFLVESLQHFFPLQKVDEKSLIKLRFASIQSLNGMVGHIPDARSGRGFYLGAEKSRSQKFT